MIRDYTKWDDQPVSLAHFAESAVRAYKLAMTPPMMPVALIVDIELQGIPIPKDAALRIPKLTVDAPPQGDTASVAEAARLLVGAENPVIIAGRVARTEEGAKRLAEFAEALQAPVIDQGGNLPSRHPLIATGGAALIRNADVILALEVTDLWSSLHFFREQLERTYGPITKKDAKVISIRTGDSFFKSNYQDFQRYTEIDLAMAADPETTFAVSYGSQPSASLRTIAREPSRNAAARSPTLVRRRSTRAPPPTTQPTPGGRER